VCPESAITLVLLSPAICTEPCQNGQCVEPNVCLCKEGFTGPTCAEKGNSAGVEIVDADSLASRENEAACSAWGMHHYRTFDGKQYYFPGNCAYNLAYECSGTFRVMVRN